MQDGPKTFQVSGNSKRKRRNYAFGAIRETDEIGQVPSKRFRFTPTTFLAFWLLVVIAVKGFFLFLDPTPALFMGDSLAYLATAFANYIPTDRSFVYGFILRVIALWPHSLHTVVLFQSALSAISAWIVAVILVRYFQARFIIACLCSLVCAVEPLQLISERYILTEAVSTFIYALLVLTAFQYLKTSRLLWLGLVQVLAVSLISIRISFLPVCLFVSFLLPLLSERRWAIYLIACLRFASRSADTRTLVVRQVVVHVLLSVALSQCLLAGYRHLYGSLMTPPQPPAYLYADGLFLAGALAPIIHPNDFPIAEHRKVIFDNLKYPLEDRRARDAQRWAEGGLCVLIIKESGGNLFVANKLARKTALRAAKRNPFGVVLLTVSTFLDYFHRDYLNQTILIDEGQDQTVPPEAIINLQKYFREDVPQSYRDSPAKSWHRKCKIWYLFLLVLPLLFVAHLFVYWRRSTPYHWMIAILALLLLEGATLTVSRPIPRYLTAMAWLGCLIVGAALTDFASGYAVKFQSKREATS